MNVPITRRGGLHPPRHQLQLSIEYDWHRVEGRMQSAPTKLVCSLSEIPNTTDDLSIDICRTEPLIKKFLTQT